MVAVVDASNDGDDDDESIVSMVDNADQLLVNKDVVDCCVSDSNDYVADVVTIVVIHDDYDESEYANMDDDVLAKQLLLSGDDNGEFLFLFFSRPRSEGWPHHGRTFSIHPCPLSF